MPRSVHICSGLLLFAVLVSPFAGGEDGAAGAVGEIGNYLDRLEKLGFAGSVVIARDGRPLHAAGYGLADRERAIAWTPATVSTVGSITKQFTGAAILALVEEGLVSVEDPITRYFDGVPEEKRSITLHHLLTHSSGIVDLDGAGDWDPIGRDEFVRRALAQELEFPPGEDYAYSNAGYSLLGAIVEQVKGMSYEEFLRRRLLLPARMYDTGYILAPWGEGRLAVGYRGGERWGTVLERPLADDGPYWVLRANGGLHSTAWDMLRWGEALLASEPLSDESRATYWTPHVDEGGGESFYGYGWVVLEAEGNRVITHNGGNGIFFADMAIVPAATLVVVIQTNVVADFPLANALLEQLGRYLLTGEALPSVPDWDRGGSRDLAALEGTYEVEGGGLLRVAAGDHEITIEAGDRRAFRHLLSLRPVNAARAERFSSRLDEIVGAYLDGDFEPLWKAYGGDGTLAEFAPRARRSLDALVEQHGALQGHEVLGTAFREGRDVTLVRLLMERGHADRAYVWDDEAEERLRGVSRRGLDPVVHVLPEVGGTFATWDGRTGTSGPVRFEPTEDGGMQLVLDQGQRVTAVREDDSTPRRSNRSTTRRRRQPNQKTALLASAGATLDRATNSVLDPEPEGPLRRLAQAKPRNGLPWPSPGGGLDPRVPSRHHEEICSTFLARLHDPVRRSRFAAYPGIRSPDRPGDVDPQRRPKRRLQRHELRGGHLRVPGIRPGHRLADGYFIRRPETR